MVETIRSSETGLYEFDHGVVVEGLLGNKEGAKCQKYKCDKTFAHAASPWRSKLLNACWGSESIIHPAARYRKGFLFQE